MIEGTSGGDVGEAQAPLGSRSGLSAVLTGVSAEIGADSYMLLELVHERGKPAVRIYACDWIYDCVESVGLEAVARIATQAAAATPGLKPVPFTPHGADFLTPPEAAALVEYGHGELYCLRLQAGRSRVYCIFSARLPGRMCAQAVARAHMTCCYAFCEHARTRGVRSATTLLSQRERECLVWVSEGKTTDEVAVILGVSSNTINSYIASAIQKFGASNRAMAIATAVRGGLI